MALQSSERIKVNMALKWTTFACAIFLSVYCSAYSFLRWCYVDDESFTHVSASSKNTRLIVKIAPVFFPLLKIEMLLHHADVSIYRLHDE